MQQALVGLLEGGACTWFGWSCLERVECEGHRCVSCVSALLSKGSEHVLMVFADAITGADGSHVEFSDT